MACCIPVLLVEQIVICRGRMDMRCSILGVIVRFVRYMWIFKLTGGSVFVTGARGRSVTGPMLRQMFGMIIAFARYAMIIVGS